MCIALCRNALTHPANTHTHAPRQYTAARAKYREQKELENALHEQRLREQQDAEAARRAAEEQALREEFDLAAAVQEVECAVANKALEVQQEAGRQRQLQRQKEEAAAEIQRQEEAAKAAEEAAQAKKLREAEKRKQKRDKEKANKAANREAAAAASVAEAARVAEEEAKKNSATKCGQCREGVLQGKGFSVANQVFCSTACVKEFRKAK
jgi:colicin import membrane protein